MPRIEELQGGSPEEVQEFLAVILLACKTLFKHEPIAFVCADSDGRIFVVPRPGSEGEIFDALGKCDWANMAQLSREYCE